MQKTWITEIGAVCVALGGAMLAAVQVLDSTFPYYNLLMFVGTFLSTLGGAIVGYRISKKLK